MWCRFSALLLLCVVFIVCVCCPAFYFLENAFSPASFPQKKKKTKTKTKTKTKKKKKKPASQQRERLVPLKNCRILFCCCSLFVCCCCFFSLPLDYYSRGLGIVFLLRNPTMRAFWLLAVLLLGGQVKRQPASAQKIAT